jgi:hypothetical protein
VYIVPLIADWENQKDITKVKNPNWRPFGESHYLDNKLISRKRSDDDFNYRSCGQ